MFADLSSGAQEMLTAYHSYISKWFIFVAIVLLSIIYVFKIWPSHKPTKFFTTAMIRVFFFAVTVSSLVASPFLFFYIGPEIPFFEFYQLPLTIYSVVLSLFAFIAFVDLLRYGPLVLLELAGLDMNDSKVKEIKRQIEKNKHGVKLK